MKKIKVQPLEARPLSLAEKRKQFAEKKAQMNREKNQIDLSVEEGGIKVTQFNKKSNSDWTGNQRNINQKRVARSASENYEMREMKRINRLAKRK